MNFIKKIFDGKTDGMVHLQFQKFSRGEFTNKAVINAKRSGSKFTINTTAEFANEMVKMCAEKLGTNKTKVTGAIVSTLDLKNDIEFTEIKQFQGVKRYLIEKDMSGKEIISLLDKFPKAFFALTFNAGDTQLKTKAKSPKSGKPGANKEETPKADFCKLITEDKKLGESFVFEKPDFKKAELKHAFMIKDIEVPAELAKTNDFARIREEAKRKGTIVREGEIDGQKVRTEKEFSA